MSNLIKFDFQGKALRTLQDENGEPLFCLADVAKALELNGTENIIRQIKEEFNTPVFNTGVIQRETGPVEATQQIESEQFNKVNAYHIKAIEAFKAQLESDASYMSKYRK